MGVLRLPLNPKWFEMTKAGVKTEDYREITPYWFVRFFDGAKGQSRLVLQGFCDGLKNENSACRWNFDNGYFFKLKAFNINFMTLGYPKSTCSERITKLEHKGIEIRTGNPEWGAEPGKLYFVIMHGGEIN